MATIANNHLKTLAGELVSQHFYLVKGKERKFTMGYKGETFDGRDPMELKEAVYQYLLENMCA